MLSGLESLVDSVCLSYHQEPVPRTFCFVAQILFQLSYFFGQRTTERRLAS